MAAQPYSYQVPPHRHVGRPAGGGEVALQKTTQRLRNACQSAIFLMKVLRAAAQAVQEPAGFAAADLAVAAAAAQATRAVWSCTAIHKLLGGLLAE